jgi:Low molecular weight phosphotyrosine protein phosphatase
VPELRDLHGQDSSCDLERPMADRLYNVLFLCTGNSARRIMAEVLLNQWDRGRFRAFSAGSHPQGAVHPIVLELLKRMNISTVGLRSKSWDEFAAQAAVSRRASRNATHFSVSEPSTAAGSGTPPVCRHRLSGPVETHLTRGGIADGKHEIEGLLDNRIKIFASLPLTSLDRIKLQERLDAIGKTRPPEGTA